MWQCYLPPDPPRGTPLPIREAAVPLTGVLIINPPLRIFELRNFPKVFIIYKKSGNFFVRFLLFTKKNRLRRAFIIFKISEAQIWALQGRFF